MAERIAWGEALKSIAPYFVQYDVQRQQEEKDRRLAQAIVDREERARAEAKEADYSRAILSAKQEYAKGREIIAPAMPGVSYPQVEEPGSYPGPVMPPAAPPTTLYEQLGGFTTPPTPAREATPTETGEFMESFYRGKPTRYTLGEKEMTPGEAARNKIAMDRELRLKKYAEYTRNQGLMGKLTDAQIAAIYKTVDDKYDMDFNLLGQLRQGLITQEEIDERKAVEKLNLVRSVAETGKAARAGALPTKPKKEEPKSTKVYKTLAEVQSAYDAKEINAAEALDWEKKLEGR